MHCNNCDASLVTDPRDGSLIVFQGPRIVAAICPRCQETVLVSKIVLSRPSVDKDLTFDSYLPVACQK